MNRALPGLRRTVIATAVAAALSGLVTANVAAQEPSRPNILVIMPDDIGYANLGIYSHGMMVPTPNIDRIGREGILFTDHYGHPSSTVRVPMLVRWPAKIPKGKISNGIQTHEDMFTTLAAAAGYGDVRGKLEARDKVCIDGVDNLAHWTSDAPSARNSVIMYNESELTAVRVGPWKTHFMVREGFFDYLRTSSLVFNLRMDPFERHDGQKSNDLANRMGVALGGQIQDVMDEHVASFKECPPRQKGGTLRMGDQ